MERHLDATTSEQASISRRRRQVTAVALSAARFAGFVSAALVAAPPAGAATGRVAAHSTGIGASCRAGRISLSGSVGHIGQGVVVSGSGWWAPVPGDGLGGVTINFTRHGNNSPVAAVVSSGGFFQVTLPIKKGDGLGSNRITATEESGCGGHVTYPTASAAFTVK